MNVRKAQKLRDGLLIAGFVVMLAAYICEPFIVIGAVISFSALIPQFLYVRCPHCRKQLGRNDGDYCQFCGGKIDRDD